VPEAVREVETKFDIPPDFEVPDLSAFGEVDTDVVEIESSYWDTENHDLLRFHVTLRRRTGGADTGWQLKTPGDGFRTERHWPDDEVAANIPMALLELVTPFTRGRSLSPVVRIDTTRTRRRICRDGVLRAEVARDAIRAIGLAADIRAPRWNEVEVELGPDADAALLAALGKTLLRAGAVNSTSRSKVGRALHGIGNEGVGTPRASAGAVLTAYLGEQTDALVAGYFTIVDENAGPAAQMEAIHKTRVACRRSRSTLKTFVDAFDERQAEQFDGELRWYAELLGEVRDREVLRLRIADAVRELPSDLVVGSVAEDIDARLAAEQAARRVDVIDAMRSERYADLLAASARWRDDPPFTAAAGRPARTLREGVRRAERKLGKRLSSAVEPRGTDEQLHGARKAGKRARYAVEATDGELGKAVRRAKELQDLLGEFHDAVVAAATLRRLAADAWARGEDGFTYGILLADERARAQTARQEVAGDAGKRFRAEN